MEKTELMLEYEARTGLKSKRVVGDHWCSEEAHTESYVDDLEERITETQAKATAYDRLMSGGKKTLKEWANIFGAYFAVGKSGVGYVFRDNPPLVESTFMGQCFAIVYPELIDFDGDWKDSLTLPDGWREK